MNGDTQLRVGIFGGTFSPVHNGHIESAKAFMEQMKLDYLYVIPTCLPPHKQIDASDEPKHRMRMCELAFAGIDGVIVSDLEIMRGGKSYTYDTLVELSRPDTRLFLMCGTDMVLTFDKWYRAEDNFKLCYPVYVRRENDPIMTQRIVAKITEYYEKYGVMFRKIITEPIDISSTLVRNKVERGEDISSLVPKSVEQYIKENRLYLKIERDNFSEGELTMLACKVKKQMSEYRFEHTRGVFKAADMLSGLYMPEHLSELRAAALLHDITKELSKEEHIALMKKHSLPFTDSDIEAEPLLHSKTAELMVKDQYPEFATKRICQALRYHTTGNDDMTLFDAIIYIADYIEDGRTNDFCVKLREYFWSAEPSRMNIEERITHLWKTVLLSLDMTIEKISARGGTVDEKTYIARDAVAKKLEG
ncbi:MAG: nicotinate (nicotinamide) nucleotide adenylyltransferase [Ruminococcaceae bacterium]|nr:nicotinate (nicotinamide) nucleotide adenylyltransferase [Oscillospiraceae bacterium]